MVSDPEINSEEQSRVHILITGRVQNVGFRLFVQQAGFRLSLKGWVRNVNYNQVEAMAEGSHRALEEFIQILSKGPGGSRVDETKLSWETFVGEFSGFAIRTSFG